MAWSAADVPAAERALAAADKPLVLGQSHLRGFDTGEIHWRTTGVWDGTDSANAAGPTKYLGDDFSHLQSYGPSAAPTYLVINAGAAGLPDFDCIAMLKHNIGSANGVNAQLTSIQIANDAAFTGPETILSGWTQPGDERMVFLDLQDAAGTVARRFSGVQYMRFRFDPSPAGIVSLGEVIIGQRRQLRHNPREPWDANNLVTDVSRFESSAGIIKDYSTRLGRRKISAAINPNETANINDFVALFEDDTAFGTQPFLWVDSPASAPTEATWMVFDPPELSGPQVGPAERQFEFSAIEQGPHFRKLGE